MLPLRLARAVRLAVSSQVEALFSKQHFYRPTPAISSHTKRPNFSTTSVTHQQTEKQNACSFYSQSTTGNKSTGGSLFRLSQSPLLASEAVQNMPHSLCQIRHYKAVMKPRLICGGCYFAWRHGRKHVECSDHPRHKQMKRVARRKVWREDYTRGSTRSAIDLYHIIPRQRARTVDRASVGTDWLAGRIGRDL